MRTKFTIDRNTQEDIPWRSEGRFYVTTIFPRG